MLVLVEGRIAVEEVVALPRPRQSDVAFQAIRQRLLGWLGVEAPAPVPAPEQPAVEPFPAREALRG